jgi:hypothetical protein
MSDKEHKAVPVSPSALIPVGGSNFFNMHDVNDLNTLIAQAPPDHQMLNRAIIAQGKIHGTAQDAEQAITGRIIQRPKLTTFKKGAIARTSDGKKVTIIKANASYTRKTHAPVHRVADGRGKVWLEKQTDLELLL